MAKKDPAADKQPDTITLAAPYAFYEEDGTFRTWQCGHVVTDPEHIALLMERKAPIIVGESQNG